jgi:hypothetical protein
MAESRNITIGELKNNDTLLTNSFDLFTSYFIRKSINTIAVSVTEDIFKKQNFTPLQIERIKNMVYLTLLTMQGTLHTSGSALAVSELFKYCGYADDPSDWIGFAIGIVINLSLDLSAWGVAKTMISTIGGVAGKWCSQWAYEKYKTRNAKKETKITSNIEEAVDLKHQPG